MADQLRKRVQLIPNMEGLAEKAAQEPLLPQEADMFAQMAVLSGQTTNRQITQFLGQLNNQVFSTAVQQAYQ